jgi:hypothetical protein
VATRCYLPKRLVFRGFEGLFVPALLAVVPSWVDKPVDHVPPRHHTLLGRLWNGDGGSTPEAASSGTLLVCPLAARIRGADIMRNLSFDGLALAFLRNLQKISFVSSALVCAADAEPKAGKQAETLCTATKHEYRVERTTVFETAEVCRATLARWRCLVSAQACPIMLCHMAQLQLYSWLCLGRGIRCLWLRRGGPERCECCESRTIPVHHHREGGDCYHGSH